MVFNATFNNISVISWWSVLLVEKTGVPEEKHWPVASHWQTLSTNVVSSTPRLSSIWTHNFSGNRHWLHSSYKSNYHMIMIMTTTTPQRVIKTILVTNTCSNYKWNRTVYPSRAPSFTPGFKWGSCCSIFIISFLCKGTTI
jgi:hypothetical protein